MNNMRVCIIGEGTMGMDIAQALAEASLDVIEFSSNEQL
jgi:3-hydroxyacyl-CoA dehydrogenase